MDYIDLTKLGTTQGDAPRQQLETTHPPWSARFSGRFIDVRFIVIMVFGSVQSSDWLTLTHLVPG
jgi:hypothetical protein